MVEKPHLRMYFERVTASVNCNSPQGPVRLISKGVPGKPSSLPAGQHFRWALGQAGVPRVGSRVQWPPWARSHNKRASLHKLRSVDASPRKLC